MKVDLMRTEAGKTIRKEIWLPRYAKEREQFTGVNLDCAN